MSGVNGMSLPEAASWYAAQGCRVFPLPPRAKDARLKGWQDKATNDPATVRDWWAQTPDANIGILNGGPFDVVDLDGPDALAAIHDRFGDATPPVLGWVATPRGWHGWIPAQGRRRRVGVLPHVDYLGTGGYAVAPPSVVDRTDETTGEVTEGCYRWTEPPVLDPEPVPDCAGWLGILDPAPDVGNPPTPRPAPLLAGTGTTRYGAAVLADECAQVATTAQGGRNDRLNLAAFRVGQLVPHEIADAEARYALADAARACGLPDAEALATIRSGLGKGTTNPRTVQHAQVLPEVTPTPASGETSCFTSPGRVEAVANGNPLPEVETSERPSWAPVNLSAFLDGSYREPEPELLPRADGVCLLYRGLTHSFHGESESGKSLLAQVEAVRILAGGGRVLFVDFESDPASVTARLLEFGATPAQVAAGFVYVRPEVQPETSPAEAAAFLAYQRERFDLAVIDGVTDALALWGAETKDNDGITRWARALPKAIADRTGAAVVMVDHVTKDAESRGRFAIGGQAKLAALTGAAYTVEVSQPLGRGLRGVVVLRVAKDRPGHVRGRSGPMRPSDRTQEAARVIIDSTGPRPVVTIESPRTTVAGEPKPWRPTAIMEAVSRLLEDAPEPLSFNGIKARTRGREQHVRAALDLLTAGGHVTVTDGPNRSRLHASTRAYRQASDPESDVYREPSEPTQDAGDTGVPPSGVSVSHPYTGGWETDTQCRPDTPGRHRETPGPTGSRSGPGPSAPVRQECAGSLTDQSADPQTARPCPECGKPLPPGRARHPECLRALESREAS